MSNKIILDRDTAAFKGQGAATGHSKGATRAPRFPCKVVVSEVV